MAAVEVILLERIEALGQMGEVVKVKPGYARNFLLPQKKAMRATKDNLAYFEKQRTQLEAQNLKRRQDAEGVAKKLEGLQVVILRQAGETGQLYGSVATRDVADAVTAAGFTVDRRQILLDQPIKTLGIFKTRVALHPEVIVGISANVAQSEEEAQMQAAGKMPAAAPDAAAAPAAAEAAPAPAETPKDAADDETDGAAKKPKAKKKATRSEE
jgi:large subunit ribosomal protein L9